MRKSRLPGSPGMFFRPASPSSGVFHLKCRGRWFDRRAHGDGRPWHPRCSARAASACGIGGNALPGVCQTIPGCGAMEQYLQGLDPPGCLEAAPTRRPVRLRLECVRGDLASRWQVTRRLAFRGRNSDAMSTARSWRVATPPRGERRPLDLLRPATRLDQYRRPP